MTPFHAYDHEYRHELCHGVLHEYFHVPVDCRRTFVAESSKVYRYDNFLRILRKFKEECCLSLHFCPIRRPRNPPLPQWTQWTSVVMAIASLHPSASKGLHWVCHPSPRPSTSANRTNSQATLMQVMMMRRAAMTRQSYPRRLNVANWRRNLLKGNAHFFAKNTLCLIKCMLALLW